MPLRGSLPLLYLMAFPFIVASLGVGLFFSTLVRTQAQAMQAGFMFILPNILLSGFMFPRAAMPPAAQWLGLNRATVRKKLAEHGLADIHRPAHRPDDDDE